MECNDPISLVETKYMIIVPIKKAMLDVYYEEVDVAISLSIVCNVRCNIIQFVCTSPLLTILLLLQLLFYCNSLPSKLLIFVLTISSLLFAFAICTNTTCDRNNQQRIVKCLLSADNT